MLTLFTHHGARRTAFLAAGVVLALTVGGCAASAGGEAAPQDADVTEASGADAVLVVPSDTVSFDGTGPQYDPAISIDVPPGAASVAITFECGGDAGHSVEFGDTMASGLGIFAGDCGKPGTFVWPITGAPASEDISLFVEESSEWTLGVTFSAESFVADPALATDCMAAIPVISAFDNAENGLLFYERITEVEWAERIAAAQTGLDALIADAQSALAEPFAELAANAGRDGIVPGEVWTGSEQLLLDVRTACNVNHTPLYGMDEFGG